MPVSQVEKVKLKKAGLAGGRLVATATSTSLQICLMTTMLFCLFTARGAPPTLDGPTAGSRWEGGRRGLTDATTLLPSLLPLGRDALRWPNRGRGCGLGAALIHPSCCTEGGCKWGPGQGAEPGQGVMFPDHSQMFLWRLTVNTAWAGWWTGLSFCLASPRAPQE